MTVHKTMTALIDDLVGQGLAANREDAAEMLVLYAKVVHETPTIKTRIQILSDSCQTLKSRLAGSNAGR